MVQDPTLCRSCHANAACSQRFRYLIYTFRPSTFFYSKNFGFLLLRIFFYQPAHSCHSIQLPSPTNFTKPKPSLPLSLTYTPTHTLNKRTKNLSVFSLFEPYSTFLHQISLSWRCVFVKDSWLPLFFSSSGSLYIFLFLTNSTYKKGYVAVT